MDRNLPRQSVGERKESETAPDPAGKSGAGVAAKPVASEAARAGGGEPPEEWRGGGAHVLLPGVTEASRSPVRNLLRHSAGGRCAVPPLPCPFLPTQLHMIQGNSGWREHQTAGQTLGPGSSTGGSVPPAGAGTPGVL